VHRVGVEPTKLARRAARLQRVELAIAPADAEWNC
jgi:hypothetical protein